MSAKKLIYICVMLVICCATDVAAKDNSRTVKNKKTKTEQSIKQTDKQLKENKQKISRSLRDLGRLETEMNGCSANIKSLTIKLDSIEGEKKSISDSIAVMEQHLARLQEVYKHALRSSRRSRTYMSNAAYVFASDNFAQAMRRVRSIKQFNKWRSRKADEITAVKQALDDRNNLLLDMERQSREALSALSAQKSALRQKQQQTNSLVNQLRGKEKELQQVLADQRAQAKRLDDQLKKILAEEEAARKKAEAEAARKKAEAEAEAARLEAEKKKNGGKTTGDSKTTPSTPGAQKDTSKPTQGSGTPTKTAPTVDTRLSNNFAENKGKLPWPIDGKYAVVKPFGTQQHPHLKYVKTDNSGIDLETEKGANVKSVFDGTVSGIFCPDGYNNVVVVRHGKYLTVYANLGKLNVKKGESVKRGQSLGSVYVNPSDDNRSILHFEVRRVISSDNVARENPEEWLK